MRVRPAAALGAFVLMSSLPPAFAEQRDFPTGEPGANVTYLDAAGPGHPTACLVGISAGLPVLALNFTIFSSGTFTVTVASMHALPPVADGSDATLKVNSIYIFAKIKNTFASGHFHVMNLVPVENTSAKIAFDAIHQIAYTAPQIDLDADDAQVPGVRLSAEPGITEPLGACVQYLGAH